MISAETFDPTKHLAITPPTSHVSMKDLGLDGEGVSPVAITAPFPLFTPEAVYQLRREVFQQDVLDKYYFTSDLAGFSVREMPESIIPFTYAAWTHPDVLAAVSKAAGIELVLEMPLEVANTNLQTYPPGKEFVQQRPVVPAVEEGASGEELAKIKEVATNDDGTGKDRPVGWHTDSYPFVCVLMLSRTDNMVGGETALKTTDGRIIKAPGPAMGQAVVLQGRHIHHAGLRAFNVKERITMVTSFRPKDPMLMDTSRLLPNIHPITKKNRINYQWSVYRFELLSQRFATMAKALRDAKEAAGPHDDDDAKGGAEVVNIAETQAWIEKQIEYLSLTSSHLMKEDWKGTY